MLKKILYFVSNTFEFIISIGLCALCVFCFYFYAPYPFDSVNILFYFEFLFDFFTNYAVSNILKFYIFCFLLGIIHLYIYKRVNIGRFWIGLISTFFTWITYLVILLIFFSFERIKYMSIYIFQDLIGFFIFYCLLSIIYKKSGDLKR